MFSRTDSRDHQPARGSQGNRTDTGTPSGARFQAQYQGLQQWIAETPPEATVKGMYLKSFLQSLDRDGHQRPTNDRFVTFKDYPLTLFMSLMLDAVATAWPHLPPREGLRRLGQIAYPTLAESTVGRVIFSVARSWSSALNLTGKAYEVSLNPSSVTIANMTQRSATVQMRDVWCFPDCYQVGVMEGAMTSYRIKGSVIAQPLDRKCDVNLLLKWQQ